MPVSAPPQWKSWLRLCRKMRERASRTGEEGVCFGAVVVWDIFGGGGTCLGKRLSGSITHAPSYIHCKCRANNVFPTIVTLQLYTGAKRAYHST